jgi:argininosuccinate synthase
MSSAGKSNMNIGELKGQTIAFAASGGLDSCTITHWLTQNGVKVACFTADLGQPDEEDFAAIGQRMRACGAVDFVAVPLQAQLADAGIAGIQAQATYEGGYWNTTGIAYFPRYANEELRYLRTDVLEEAMTRFAFS